MRALEAHGSDLDATLLARARLLMGRIEEGRAPEEGMRLALASAIHRARRSTRLRSSQHLRQVELVRERAERMAELLTTRELAELERHGLGEVLAVHIRRELLLIDDETGVLIGAGLLALIAVTALLGHGTEGVRDAIAGLLLLALGLFAWLGARALRRGDAVGDRAHDKVVVCARGLVVLARGGSLGCPWVDVADVRQEQRKPGQRSHVLEVARHERPALRFGPGLPTVTTLAAQVLRAWRANDPRATAKTLVR